MFKNKTKKFCVITLFALCLLFSTFLFACNGCRVVNFYQEWFYSVERVEFVYNDREWEKLTYIEKPEEIEEFLYKFSKLEFTNFVLTSCTPFLNDFWIVLYFNDNSIRRIGDWQTFIYDYINGEKVRRRFVSAAATVTSIQEWTNLWSQYYNISLDGRWNI